MKVNIDDLVIVPPHPRYAKAYREAVLSSFEFISAFVKIDGIKSTNFKDVSDYLLRLRKLSNTYPSFLLVHEDKVLSHIQWTPASNVKGVQFMYWIRKGYQGQGIITEVVDLLVKRAFLGYPYEYVQLEIDEANQSGKRVAQKLGFDLAGVVDGVKSGYLATGSIEIWTKPNPYTVLSTQGNAT